MQRSKPRPRVHRTGGQIFLNIDEIWLDGLPLVLALLFWGLCITLSLGLWRGRVTDAPPALTAGAASRLQNHVYKRAAALLLILGAGGGFLPSLFMFAKTGQVWSVNHQAPHSMVDQYLLLHIPLAVLWALLVGVQLWSGQVRGRKQLHITFGWLGLATGVVGIGVIGGWIWPMVNDFAHGFDSPNAGAGIYTMAMGVGVVVNGLLAGYCARKRDFARHKDYVLMTLFWTMDPGIHRLNMWLMRLLGDDIWAPEQTAGLGIAIAKLPANLTLIVWAFVVATMARRVNAIIWSNIAGQVALWCFGTFAVVGVFHGPGIAQAVFLASATFFLVAWSGSRLALR